MRFDFPRCVVDGGPVTLMRAVRFHVRRVRDGGPLTLSGIERGLC